jgi:hypothetical protein
MGELQPTPLCVDMFYNRTRKVLREWEHLAVSRLESEGIVDIDDRGTASDVRVRVMEDAQPDACVRCEILLPHALAWAAARMAPTGNALSI